MRAFFLAILIAGCGAPAASTAGAAPEPAAAAPAAAAEAGMAELSMEVRELI